MDTSRESRQLENHLETGEKIVYQSPRKWSLILDAALLFLTFLLFLFLFIGLFLYLQYDYNLIKSLPGWMSAPSTNLTAQVIAILGWGSLFFSAVALLQMLGTGWVFFGAQITLTDRRIMGNTGRYILRKLDIPLESVAWINFPNRIISKGPLVIHSKSGRNTALWSLSRPEIFLGFLEKLYTPETRPLIHKSVSCGRVAFGGLGLVFLCVAIFAIFASKTPLLGNNPRALSIPERLALQSPGATSPEQNTKLPPNTAIPTPKRPTRTPTPLPVLVDFDSISNYSVGTEVILVGQLVMPGSTNCRDTCGIWLRNPQKYSQEITIFLYIPLASDTPAPNMMARLPDKYRESDFKVRLDNGAFVGNHSTVRIYGTLCETTDGDLAICQISKIEKAKLQ
jgi:hypothetical protein